MKKIPLTQNKLASIDNEDFELISQYKWCVSKKHSISYAITSAIKNNIKTTLKMHRLIMKIVDPKIQIDHVDGDGLNNQKLNLRICTSQQNQRNRQKNKVSSSKFKGIWWDKRVKKWQVSIQIGKKRKHLGYFHNEIEAAKAYDTAAKKYFGEFARFNFNY